MEEVSTLYTNWFKPLLSAKPATAYGLSVGRQNQVVAFAGRLITYILGIFRGPSSVPEKFTASHTATFPSNTTTVFPDNTACVVDEFTRFNGDLPDGLKSNPFGFQPYHSQNPLLLSYNGQ
ncbi:MAG: hypothetical protein EOO39_12105 [Cytophagaceae bacterium]|nr:MAG: hypothetical protein EOO39_12105 [Cytophagaceae bacterium]